MHVKIRINFLTKCIRLNDVIHKNENLNLLES